MVISTNKPITIYPTGNENSSTHIDRMLKRKLHSLVSLIVSRDFTDLQITNTNILAIDNLNIMYKVKYIYVCMYMYTRPVL